MERLTLASPRPYFVTLPRRARAEIRRRACWNIVHQTLNRTYKLLCEVSYKVLCEIRLPGERLGELMAHTNGLGRILEVRHVLLGGPYCGVFGAFRLALLLEPTLTVDGGPAAVAGGRYSLAVAGV
jgi:hypothetical protein